MSKKSIFNFRGSKEKYSGRSYNFTENDIRYVMSYTKSNAEASRYLGVNLITYKKYAKSFIDSESGKTLWELHKNQFGKGVRNPWMKKSPMIINTIRLDTEDILNGKHRHLTPWYVKKRLIAEGYLEDTCHVCKFNERRLIDDKQPLTLDYIDGDNRNYSIDNIRLICYNCRFLYRGNMVGRKSKGKLTYFNDDKVAIGNTGIVRKVQDYEFK